MWIGGKPNHRDRSGMASDMRSSFGIGALISTILGGAGGVLIGHLKNKSEEKDLEKAINEKKKQITPTMGPLSLPSQ